MKFDPQKSFGHPVLRPGSEDYVHADFQSGIGFGINEKNENQYLLSYDVAIGVKELRDLITAKRGAVQIELNCRTTFYSRVYEINFLKGAVPIEANLVRGGLEICCYVTAKKIIAGFTSPKINSEFGKGAITFPRYAVLACEAPIYYWVDREAFRNITSIFDYGQDPELSEGVWRLNLEEDRVQIILSPNQLAILKQAQNSKQNQAIILNAIIFGAVVEIVNTLKVKNDFVGRRWAQNVLAKCSALGVQLGDSANAIDVAQKLMSKPLATLNSLVFKSGDDN